MQFNLETLSFLNELELATGWGQLGLEDLQGQMMSAMALGLAPEEMPEVAVIEAFDTLMGGLQPAAIGDFDPTSVLTTKTDDQGMLELVLGPALFAATDDDGNKTGAIVIKSGNCLFTFNLKGTEGKAGNLSGDIEVLEKEGKNEDGGDETYLSVGWDVYLADPIDETITMPMVLDPENKVSKGKFKQSLKAGDVAQYLKPVPTGGGWIGLNDLAVGEYLLTALVENKPHAEYGRSWEMTLEGVGPVRSKGKLLVKKLIQRAPKMIALLKLGQPITFVVSSKKEMSQGTQVNCDFFMRVPHGSPAIKSAAPAVAELPAADQTVDVPVQKELAPSF